MMRFLQRRSSQRGQAIVEAAMMMPLLISLMVGAYDASQFASDKLQIIAGTRHGARLASQLGGKPNNPAPPATHTCDGTLPAATTLASIDKQIVLSVAAATSVVTSATVKEIDIYLPAAARLPAVFVNGDPINRYKPDGTAYAAQADDVTPAPPAVPFNLTARCQGPLGSSPKDVSIGIRVVWNYSAAFGGGQGNGPLTFHNVIEYSVEKMTLCTDNCL
jgi:hypothetical protein